MVTALFVFHGTPFQSAQAQAKIDIPFFCGRDPVLNGTLYKVG